MEEWLDYVAPPSTPINQPYSAESSTDTIARIEKLEREIKRLDALTSELTLMVIETQAQASNSGKDSTTASPVVFRVTDMI